MPKSTGEGRCALCGRVVGVYTPSMMRDVLFPQRHKRPDKTWCTGDNVIARPLDHPLAFTPANYPDLAAAIGPRPEFVEPFVLPDHARRPMPEDPDTLAVIVAGLDTWWAALTPGDKVTALLRMIAPGVDTMPWREALDLVRPDPEETP